MSREIKNLGASPPGKNIEKHEFDASNEESNPHVGLDHPFFKIAADYKHEWIQLPLTLLLVVLFFFLGQLPFTTYASWRVKQTFPDDWAAQLKRVGDPSNWVELGIHELVGLGLYLLTFAGATLGLYIAVKIVRNRPFITLITPFKRIIKSKILFGFMLWLVITMIGEAAAYYMSPQEYVWNFQMIPFILLVILCFTILPIQTSFEEFFVRGYLMQRFGLWFKIPALALLFTSMLFASLHIMNPEVAKYGTITMLSYYTIAGLFLGTMTIMDDSLELALGVHFATNLSSALFVSYDGAALQTPALFKMINTEMDVTTSGFVVMALIFLGICWKKYSWPSPMYMFKKIKINNNYDENNIADLLIDN